MDGGELRNSELKPCSQCTHCMVGIQRDCKFPGGSPCRGLRGFCVPSPAISHCFCSLAPAGLCCQQQQVKEPSRALPHPLPGVSQGLFTPLSPNLQPETVLSWEKPVLLGHGPARSAAAVPAPPDIPKLVPGHQTAGPWRIRVAGDQKHPSPTGDRANRVSCRSSATCVYCLCKKSGSSALPTPLPDPEKTRQAVQKLMEVEKP